MLSSLDSFAKNLPGAKLAEFRFSHFLLNHRVQWYMLHCMTQPSVPEADLKTMWHLFMVLYEEHSKVEDVIMFPAVEKSKPDVHAMLKAQHTALDDAIKKVNDAMAASGSVDAARSALLELAKEYIPHTVDEEEKMLPVLTAMPAETRDTMAKSVGAHFKSVPDGAWMLLSMRDVACGSGDTEMWTHTNSWFLRTIVAGVFLAWNGTYAKYCTLFPAPKDGQWMGQLKTACKL
eukprot:PhM_4_TR3551/c0_g1_i2/m.46235